MQFKTVFLSSCAAALALAQSSVLTFTRVSSPITAGHATALTYATNDTTSPVTILLRKGAATDLKTVATLTDHATGGQYLWTPSTSLATGSDYALEITQGSQVNYYGPFSIQGGSGSTGSSSGPSSYPISSRVSARPTYNANSTTILPGTGAASYGTASTFARNTTLSSATLPTTRKTTSVTTTGAATSGGQATSTGSGSHSTSSAPANAASGLEAGSSIALVLGAVAAILYV